MKIFQKYAVYVLVLVLGGFAGGVLNSSLSPDCICECPECPDALLEVQPLTINADELAKIRRSNVTINYAPQYQGQVVVGQCDTTLTTE